MRLALREALVASEAGDVPVGAAIVDSEGRIVAADHNRREANGDATAHAEILAIRAAGEKVGGWRLDGLTLVVTLEPCAMCAMAAVWARLDRIVYAAADPKAGAAWSLYNIPQDERLNHRCSIVSGVMEVEANVMLREFFGGRRRSG